MTQQYSIDERLVLIINELQSVGITLEEAEGQFRAKYIAAALKRTKGNVTRAARAIGVHRNTLHNNMAEEFKRYRARRTAIVHAPIYRPKVSSVKRRTP